MATVKVNAGICGMHAVIRAVADQPYGTVKIEIESNCPDVQKMAEELHEVKSVGEISQRGEGPRTQRAAKKLPHTACVAPSAIIKAIEVAAGLALPADATISVSAE